jgi:hypothetical protein
LDAIKKEFPATKVVVISAGGRKRSIDYLASAQLIGVASRVLSNAISACALTC